MMAVERGAPDLVKLFLEAHANPDLQGIYASLKVNILASHIPFKVHVMQV